MAAARAILLRRGGRPSETVGLLEGPRPGADYPRHYVPAFSCADTARRVARWLPEAPTLHLDRATGCEYDITEEVEHKLSRHGLSRREIMATSGGRLAASSVAYAPIVIGTFIRLRVPKTREPWCDDEHLFKLCEVPMDDALMLPFDHNVGLLLPGDVLDEDAREVVFACHVIQAWGRRRSCRR